MLASDGSRRFGSSTGSPIVSVIAAWTVGVSSGSYGAGSPTESRSSSIVSSAKTSLRSTIACTSAAVRALGDRQELQRANASVLCSRGASASSARIATAARRSPSIATTWP